MDYYADVVTTITGIDWYQGSNGSNVPPDQPTETDYVSPNTGESISLTENKQLGFVSTGFSNINGNYDYLYRSFFEMESVASEGAYDMAPQDTTQEIQVPPSTLTSGGGSVPVQTTTTDDGRTVTFPKDTWVDLGPAMSDDSLTPAEQAFANDVDASGVSSASHSYKALGDFIRENLGEYEAAVGDVAQNPQISNNASLSPNGEILLGAAGAFAGGLALTVGSPLIGAALVVGGVIVAIDGALSSADIGSIGAEIKKFHVYGH